MGAKGKLPIKWTDCYRKELCATGGIISSSSIVGDWDSSFRCPLKGGTKMAGDTTTGPGTSVATAGPSSAATTDAAQHNYHGLCPLYHIIRTKEAGKGSGQEVRVVRPRRLIVSSYLLSTAS